MNRHSAASLPGEDLVAQGLADLAQGKLTECSLLVLIAAPRLKRLGIQVPPPRASHSTKRPGNLSRRGAMVVEQTNKAESLRPSRLCGSSAISIRPKAIRGADSSLDLPVHPYEHQLYERLGKRLGTAAHSYYNSLIRRIVSYARALEREKSRKQTSTAGQ